MPLPAPSSNLPTRYSSRCLQDDGWQHMLKLPASLLITPSTLCCCLQDDGWQEMLKLVEFYKENAAILR